VVKTFACDAVYSIGSFKGSKMISSACLA